VKDGSQEGCAKIFFHKDWLFGGCKFTNIICSGAQIDLTNAVILFFFIGGLLDNKNLANPAN